MVVWKFQFDKEILPRHRDLKLHPLVQHPPLKPRGALYGGRTVDMVLHYEIREGETIQYYIVISL